MTETTKTHHEVTLTIPVEWVEQAQSDDLTESCQGLRLIVNHLHTYGAPDMSDGAAMRTLCAVQIGISKVERS